MKALYLIRHAESNWTGPDTDDHDRPLSQRGEREKMVMAKFAKSNFPEIQIVYSSSATRALDLAAFIHRHHGAQLQIHDSLYTFDSSRLVKVVLELPDYLNHVAVIGHNPAVTEVLNQLSNFGREDKVSNFPTAAIAMLEFDCQRWGDIKQGMGRLVDFARPKTGCEND
ncbi:histidine phosphatase family protein [Arenicella sp. 4NH20-0111]|uniref:SixA phosphatase family protein n=1 Tax=Arenicella sp. 4NH20-0111 TaxID=3127648 RepID=UPI00310C5BBD